MRAEAKQRTHGCIGPDLTIGQITGPQSQLAGTGSKFHQLLALSQLRFDPATAAALQK